MNYTQPPLFYTEEEHTTALETMKQDAEYRIQIARDSMNATNQEYTLTAVKEMVQDYTLDRETGIAVYNRIAVANGWDEITNLTRKWTVEVIYNGTTIGEFADVEADDEDHATQEVGENLEIEATLNLTVTYNNDSVSGEAYINEWDIADEFIFNAVEQE